MLERHSSKDHVGIYSHTSRGSSRATPSGENLELERVSVAFRSLELRTIIDFEDLLSFLLTVIPYFDQ